MSPYESFDFDFIDFDNYESTVSDTESSNTNNGSGWSNFFGGASDLASTILGSKPQVQTKVSLDKNLMMYLGLGFVGLVLFLKK